MNFNAKKGRNKFLARMIFCLCFVLSFIQKFKEHKKGQNNDSSEGDSAGFICMWKWARKSFQVQNITQMLAQFL